MVEGNFKVGLKRGTFWITRYFSWFGYHYKYGEISTKLQDKRGDFCGFIVSMPNLQKSIPSSILYGTVMSEILSIERSTSSSVSFYEKSSALITRIKGI